MFTSPDPPHTPDALDDDRWEATRRPHSPRPALLYRSAYRSALVVGRLDDGGDFAVVAGTHGRHYPYYHPRSRWDDLLLVVGPLRLRAVGRRLSGLSLDLHLPGPATIAYHGRASDSAGALLDVDLHLELQATSFPPRPEGIGVGRLLLGLLWQPALVRGTGTVSVNGTPRSEIRQLAGEAERGLLTNLRAPAFRFGFDYLAVTRPAGEPAAFVRFNTWPLARGAGALPLRLLLSMAAASEALTLTPSGARPGDTAGLDARPDEAAEPLVRSPVPLGPATLERQLVRFGFGDAARFGLLEHVSPG